MLARPSIASNSRAWKAKVDGLANNEPVWLQVAHCIGRSNSACNWLAWDIALSQVACQRKQLWWQQISRPVHHLPIVDQKDRLLCEESVENLANLCIVVDQFNNNSLRMLSLNCVHLTLLSTLAITMIVSTYLNQPIKWLCPARGSRTTTTTNCPPLDRLTYWLYNMCPQTCPQLLFASSISSTDRRTR